MSRRIRENRDGSRRHSMRHTWRGWVCRMIGHRIPVGLNYHPICDRCGRFW